MVCKAKITRMICIYNALCKNCMKYQVRKWNCHITLMLPLQYVSFIVILIFWRIWHDLMVLSSLHISLLICIAPISSFRATCNFQLDFILYHNLQYTALSPSHPRPNHAPLWHINLQAQTQNKRDPKRRERKKGSQNPLPQIQTHIYPPMIFTPSSSRLLI